MLPFVVSDCTLMQEPCTAFEGRDEVELPGARVDCNRSVISSSLVCTLVVVVGSKHLFYIVWIFFFKYFVIQFGWLKACVELVF